MQIMSLAFGSGKDVSCCMLCAPGSLPLPERWNGESASAALHLEETDPSDQVWPTMARMTCTSWPTMALHGQLWHI